MEQEKKYIVGIDIGTTKVLAMVGSMDDKGKLEICGHGMSESIGVKRGVVINIDETASAIRKAVDKAFHGLDVKFSGAFVSIAGQHIHSVMNRGLRYIEHADHEIRKSDVEALTSDMFKISVDRGDQIIHVIPQSYSVDQESGFKNPVGISGRRLEANFHIVLAQMTSVRNIEKCVNRAGLEVIDLLLEPLASAEAVLSYDEKEAGVALVDIGGGTSDIAVFYDGIIRHSAIIPFGGSAVTNDIKEGCNILQRQAELLKVQFGNAIGDLADPNKYISIPGINGRKPKEISAQNLAFIIQARMEEIIDAIYYEIEKSGISNKLGAGIVLTGGGAMLKYLPELMAHRTGLDVRIGLPTTILSAQSPEKVCQTRNTAALGLLLNGFTHPRANQVVKPDNTEESIPEILGEEDHNKVGLFSRVKRSLLNIIDEN